MLSKIVIYLYQLQFFLWANGAPSYCLVEITLKIVLQASLLFQLFLNFPSQYYLKKLENKKDLY